MHLERLPFMGHARDLIVGSQSSEQQGVNFTFPSDNFAVRNALQTTKGQIDGLGVSAEFHGTFEIVLAEALNNVVEHAYCDISGVIEVNLQREGQNLHVTILDDGHPMPDGNLPDGAPHDLAQMEDALPEGGFGWFLIRELTQNLKYTRSDQRNKLSFSIPLDQPQ